jgi:hypothetical protein
MFWGAFRDLAHVIAAEIALPASRGGDTTVDNPVQRQLVLCRSVAELAALVAAPGVDLSTPRRARGRCRPALRWLPFPRVTALGPRPDFMGAVADLAVAVSATGEKLARGGAGNCELAAAPDLCGAVR